MTDSQGTRREAVVSYRADQQANFLIPAETAPGTAEVKVDNYGHNPWSQTIEINTVAPGLFSLPTHQDPGSVHFPIAAGFAIRDLGDGKQDIVPLFQPVDDAQQPGTFALHPVALGPDAQGLYLSIYGTGFANNGGLENVSAEINGVPVPILYAGPQLEYDGLDLVNIGPLPREILAGDGLEFVKILVQGAPSNSVQLDVLQ